MLKDRATEQELYWMTEAEYRQWEAELATADPVTGPLSNIRWSAVLQTC